jgi:hypothetical protein
VFGSTMLEVTIGLVLVYLLLSLICTALKETLEARLKIRASQLEKGLRVLLHDPEGTQLLQNLYNHPLINGLFIGDYDPDKVRSKFTKMTSLPSYIPASNFATALIDTIVRGPVGTDSPPPTGEITFDSLRAAVTNSTTLKPSVQRVMLIMLDSAHGDLAKAQANIETWFNSGMDRVSSWYKRQTQWILILIGLVIAVALNVDSVKVATELYRNDTLRAGAVAQAGAVTKDGVMSSDLQKNALATLDKMKLPIGWQDYASKPVFSKDSFQELLKIIYASLLGWLITAIAISFGAPFWFDLLNKLISIRSSVKPQEKTSTPPAASGTQTQSDPAATLASTKGVASVPDVAIFKPHEWASGHDPQGGAL